MTRKSIMLISILLLVSSCGLNKEKIAELEKQINNYSVYSYNNYFSNEKFILNQIRTVHESEETVVYYNVERKVNNIFDELEPKKQYSMMIDLLDKLKFSNKGTSCGKNFSCFLERLTLNSSENTYYMKYDEDKQDLEMVINKTQIFKPYIKN